MDGVRSIGGHDWYMERSNSMNFTDTAFCKLRNHCRECRSDPALRQRFAARFGPFTCPEGHTFTDTEEPAVRPPPKQPCRNCRGL
jgi:hypothetical protein